MRATLRARDEHLQDWSPSWEQCPLGTITPMVAEMAAEDSPGSICSPGVPSPKDYSLTARVI